MDGSGEGSLREVVVAPDIVYGRKLGMALTMDLYRPANRNGAAVLFMNSGGFESGKLTQYVEEEPCRYRALAPDELTVDGSPEPIPLLSQFSFAPLLGRGFTVIDVRHGSGPRFTLEEIVSDVRRAVRFVRCHCQRFDVDPQRIGLWGASAGGFLAVFLGVTGDGGDRAAQDPVERTACEVAVVATYYAAGYDFAVDAERFPEVIASLPSLQMDREVLAAHSIRPHIDADAPPTLIVYGTDDFPFITGACESIHADLEAAGVESRLVALEGTGHEFSGEDGFHAHHAQRAVDEVEAWFSKFLSAEPIGEQSPVD
ncbi:MAG: alpha/beta hydrolase [Candidatus Bipolaricaulota bacterium]|nr:MAG: alpha/beta hydrolase [Candidatus Bipolaricaulota bacterium]